MNHYPRVTIPKTELVKRGLWDQCKSRFGVTDKDQSVTVFVGTTFTYRVVDQKRVMRGQPAPKPVEDPLGKRKPKAAAADHWEEPSPPPAKPST